MPLHRVSRELFRSAQPDRGLLERLQSKARLQAVVNLRLESRDSEALCQELGLRYHYIPVMDWSIPGFGQVEDFLQLMLEPENQPALVHCWGGVGRTGVFVSCYRVRQGMAWEQALRLSDDETPHIQMNELQRRFVRDFAKTERE